MPHLTKTMTNIRKSLLAAIKALLRGNKMLFHTILNALHLSSKPKGDSSPTTPDQAAVDPASLPKDISSSSDETTPTPTVTATTTPALSSSPPSTPKNAVQLQSFLEEAETLLLGPVKDDARLLSLARKLKEQFRNRMASSEACMLPGYNSRLPSGCESGQFLSLDVGGSTLRVALVELKGRKLGKGRRRKVGGGERVGERGGGEEEKKRAGKRDGEEVEAEEDNGEEDEGEGEITSRIVKLRTYPIGPEIKALVGMDFFDWLARRILETVEKDMNLKDYSTENPILMGLAWSFPIQQTSLSTGTLRPMGKNFAASSTLLNHDISTLIHTACAHRTLPISLRCIINDADATLLSLAYLTPTTTHFGLVLGTGVNIAVHLPLPPRSPLALAKFGQRSEEWWKKAEHVVVNTELGMFGEGVLKFTRWDDRLNEGHSNPEFQPLEHFVSGMYLGEVVRILLLEAVEKGGLLGGVPPKGLEVAYALGTEVLSFLEGAVSLEEGMGYFNGLYPSVVPATEGDIEMIRALASCVSRRSAAIVAASLYALWELRREFEASPSTSPASRESATPAPAPSASTSLTSASQSKTVVAFNGSVIEHYPSYLANCQAYLDALVSAGGAEGHRIELVEAKESSLLGAAVGLAAAEGVGM